MIICQLSPPLHDCHQRAFAERSVSWPEIKKEGAGLPVEVRSQDSPAVTSVPASAACLGVETDSSPSVLMRGTLDSVIQYALGFDRQCFLILNSGLASLSLQT